MEWPVGAERGLMRACDCSDEALKVIGNVFVPSTRNPPPRSTWRSTCHIRQLNDDLAEHLPYKATD